MSLLRRPLLCLFAMGIALAAPAQSNTPASPRPALPGGQASAKANILTPPLPTAESPVDFFRKLLLMSPPERNQLLANRTPEGRTRIQAKVMEYLALSPDERELRLRATELRWYLTPLMNVPATNRAAQLARIPQELLPLVKSRLVQWDLLPPPLQQEFLANEKVLPYFAQAPAAANAQQAKIEAQFRWLFDLQPGEKQRLLGTLSTPERTQMEKTLKTFEQLPPQQRVLCERNYAKFAGMSGAERNEFLQNADKWSKMSPQERQTWRDLVAHVPIWPPMPSIMPPMPPAPPKIVKGGMATN